MEKVARHGTVQGIMEVPMKWRKIFVTAHDLTPEQHIHIQASFQKHLDNGCSKTINMSVTATVEDVKKAYLLSWETGCKGITIYRDQSKAQQVLNIPAHIGKTAEKSVEGGSASGGKEVKDEIVNIHKVPPPQRDAGAEIGPNGSILGNSV